MNPADMNPADPWAEFQRLLSPRPTTFEHALTTPISTLQQILQLLTAEAAAPAPRFTEDDLALIAGQNSPTLLGIAHSLADALESTPAFAIETGLHPQAVRETIARQTDASTLATTAHRVAQAATNGEIMAGATLDTLCRRVLALAADAAADPTRGPGERAALACAFQAAQTHLAELDQDARAPRPTP